MLLEAVKKGYPVITKNYNIEQTPIAPWFIQKSRKIGVEKIPFLNRIISAKGDKTINLAQGA